MSFVFVLNVTKKGVCSNGTQNKQYFIHWSIDDLINRPWPTGADREPWGAHGNQRGTSGDNTI